MIPHQNHVCLVGHAHKVSRSDEKVYFTVVSRDLVFGPEETYPVFNRIAARVPVKLGRVVREGSRLVVMGKIATCRSTGYTFIDATCVMEDDR